MKRFDLVFEINGKPVKTTRELRNIIASHKPGDTIDLTIFRKKEKKTVAVKVTEARDNITIRSDREDEEGRIIDLGMSLQENSRALSRRYDLETTEGIVIMEITRGGVAYEHGLRTGDVILAVNRTGINSVGQFRRIMSEKSGSRVFLTISRGGSETMLRFSVPE
ncbi:MAG: PDZ domain-containing protein [bacterium]|nr:PDZ domain-containing protein [bacterium]